MANFHFTSFVRIKDLSIVQDEKLIFRQEKGSSKNFLKQAYRHLNLSYPKYHKMDDLCKLGILATELLFKNKPDSSTALIFSNAASSLGTDKKHWAGMSQIVSPAVFVYTLPNIVLGEISIKYGLQSENAFFVEEEFNAELLVDYSLALLQNRKAAAVVSGWIDVKNDEYNVLLCLISREGIIPFSTKNLKFLYFYENE